MIPAQQQDIVPQKKKSRKVLLVLPPELKDYNINPEAKDSWKVAKRHRANQQRSHLRADQIRQLMEIDTVPGCYLGENTLPRYLLPLSEEMGEVIRRHGKEKAELAMTLLHTQSEQLKKRADNSLLLVKQIYAEENDDSFPKAAALITHMVNHYRGLEIKCLKTTFKREYENRPLSLSALGELVAKPAPATSAAAAMSSKSTAPPPKSVPKPQEKLIGPAPQQRPNQSASRGNKQMKKRGQSRGRANNNQVQNQRNFNPNYSNRGNFRGRYPTPNRGRGRGRGQRGFGGPQGGRGQEYSLAREIANALQAYL